MTGSVASGLSAVMCPKTSPCEAVRRVVCGHVSEDVTVVMLNLMAETIEDYYARVIAATDDEGRLGFPTEGIPYWEIFPFEAEGLRLKRMGPPGRGRGAS